MPTTKELLNHFDQQNKLLAGSLQPMVKPEDVQQDFAQAPMTDAQLGEQAGVSSYNQMVPSVNQLMQTGSPLRRQYSPESEAQQAQDAAAFQQAQMQQEANPFDLSRGPSSLIGDIASGVNKVLTFGDRPAQEAAAAPMAPSDQPLPPPTGKAQSEITAAGGPSLGRVTAPEIAPSSAELSAEKDIQAQKESGVLPKETREQMQKRLQLEATGGLEATKEQMKAYEPIVQMHNEAYNKWQEAQKNIDSEKNKLADAISKTPTDMVSSSGFWGKLAFVAANLTGLGGVANQLIKTDLAKQVQDYKAGISKSNSLINIYMKQGASAEEAYNKSLQMMTGYTQLAHQYALQKIAASPEEILHKVNEGMAAQQKAQNDINYKNTQQEIELAKNISARQQKERETSIKVQEANIGARGKEATYTEPSVSEKLKVRPIDRQINALPRIKQAMGGQVGADLTEAGAQAILRKAADPGNPYIDKLTTGLKQVISGYSDEQVANIQKLGKDLRLFLDADAELNPKRATGNIQERLNAVLPSIGGGKGAMADSYERIEEMLRSNQKGQTARNLLQAKKNRK